MNADKEIMENLLNTVKGVCDLYMHGTIESSTQNVHAAFDERAGREPVYAKRNLQSDVPAGLVSHGTGPAAADRQGARQVRQRLTTPENGSPPASRCAGFPFARRSLSKGRLP